MMKIGGENYVTDDDRLTRMSKCDNKPLMPVIFTSDHHDDCDYFDDYHRDFPG